MIKLFHQHSCSINRVVLLIMLCYQQICAINRAVLSDGAHYDQSDVIIRRADLLSSSYYSHNSDGTKVVFCSSVRLKLILYLLIGNLPEIWKIGILIIFCQYLELHLAIEFWSNNVCRGKWVCPQLTFLKMGLCLLNHHRLNYLNLKVHFSCLCCWCLHSMSFYSIFSRYLGDFSFCFVVCFYIACFTLIPIEIWYVIGCNCLRCDEISFVMITH